MTKAPVQTVDINAAGQKIGRVASQAAKALMGKTSVSFTPNIDGGTKVAITNASKLHTTEKKRRTMMYHTYSGYPSGLKPETLASLVARKGYKEALRRAIQGMLPRNATRNARMKRLHISE